MGRLAVGTLTFGLLTVAIVSAARANQKCTRGITEEIVRLARKWATARGIPVEWVLATIKLESGGQSCRVGDQGRSIGLMQVNADAHAALLSELGMTKNSLFDPDSNIAVGTAVLRERWEQVYAAGGARATVPIGMLVALAYRGPQATLNALRAGTVLPYPERAERWTAALRETAPLV